MILLKKTDKKTKNGHFYWIAKCECEAVIECLKTKKYCEECRKKHRTNLNKELSQKRLRSIQIDLSFSPQNMYFWGFLWADGCISKNKNKNLIVLTINSNDAKDINSIIPSIFKRYTYKRNRYSIKTKDISTFQLTHNNYTNFLLNNGYDLKQIPNKILEENKYYYLWLRGLIDGDGCWYHNKYSRQFSIASNYEQDWTFIEKIFIKLGIKYQIQKRTTKTGNSSCIRTSNKKDIKKLYEYLYQDYLEIGLKRKQEKVKGMI